MKTKKIYVDRPNYKSVRSVDDIQRCLSSELEEMTVDEVLAAGDEKLSKLLVEEGYDPGGLKVIDFADEKVPFSPWVGREVSALVPRDALVEKVSQAIVSEKVTVLTGVMGVGKSTLIKKLVLPTLRKKGKISSWVTIDCAPLRMESISLLQREAVWALCSPDDESFYKYLRKFESQELLFSKINHSMPKNSVIFFDQIEHLVEGKGILDWLESTLINNLIKEDYRVVLSHRGNLSGRKNYLISHYEKVEVPHLNQEEIGQWLGSSFFKNRYPEIDVSMVMSITGGVTRLVADFYSFINSADIKNGSTEKSILDRFLYSRVHCGMMKEVQRFVRRAREYPTVWNAIVSSSGLLIGFKDDEKLDLLIGTGVIRKTSNGCYIYTSMVYKTRMALLLGGDGLLLLGVRADMEELYCSGAVAKMKKWPEFSLEPILRMLCAERKPAEVLKTIKKLLLSWKIDADVYIRDSENRHLWYLLENQEETIPLKSVKQREFAKSIRSGATALTSEGTFYIPITGNSGLVEMVLYGRFTKSYTDYSYRTRIEMLEGMLRGMKSVLANTVERISLSRDKRYRKKVLLDYQSHDARDIQLLEEVGCFSVVVLERSGSIWRISRCQYLGGTHGKLDLWSQFNNERLELIANYPTGAGLVLAGEELKYVFPQVGEKELAAYIRPVSNVGGGCKLVVFIFDGKYSKNINGITQKHLRSVAVEMVA